MACDAEPLRVGDAMTIDQEQIWQHGEFVEGGECERHLTKRPEARNVRKGDRTEGYPVLYHLQVRQSKHHDGRPPDHNTGCSAWVADVDAGHRSHIREIVFLHHRRGECLPDPPSIVSAEIPAMMKRRVHLVSLPAIHVEARVGAIHGRLTRSWAAAETMSRHVTGPDRSCESLR